MFKRVKAKKEVENPASFFIFIFCIVKKKRYNIMIKKEYFCKQDVYNVKVAFVVKLICKEDLSSDR